MSVKINCQHCGKVAFDYNTEPLKEPKIKVGMKFKGGGYNPKLIGEVMAVSGDHISVKYSDGCYTGEWINNIRFLKK